MKYDLGQVAVRKRNRLPHWDARDAIYFVTFNLFDAIPEEVRSKRRAEADAQLAHIRATRGSVTIAERKAIDVWLAVKLGESLDQSHGMCFLRAPRVATIVASALTYFDEKRYSLLAWCVMPNHVHVVMEACADLKATVHSWKSFSANEANELLGRSGPFWRADYFDRCIRNSKELHNTVEYVLRNPAEAGLRDWPFLRVYSDRLRS